MFRPRFPVILSLLLIGCHSPAEPFPSDDQSLQIPRPGSHQLRILTPDILELTLITTKRSQSAPVEHWNFVGKDGRVRLPAPKDFQVLVDGHALSALSVRDVGFNRRVIYAPLKERDLRIGNRLYLKLNESLQDNQTVEVRNTANLWPASTQFKTKVDPLRWSPLIHVNQTGYLPRHPKTAMIGYYLGSLGELDLQKDRTGTNRSQNPLAFQLLEAESGKVAFEAKLQLRADRGFSFATYQRVLEADFSNFTQPGDYRIVIPGLGASFPFIIGDDVAGAWARTYALGIYHQRCGTDNELPFTRFTHGPCHVAPAEVPNMSSKFEAVNYVLEKETEGANEDRRHTTPPLKNVAASLYPFVNKGPANVRGGHHDAGDYSKYTINSATFVHLLVFAADNFPGVSELDNLGLPESGDGRSDILQEAKWEADFLARMQDDDGGFYFLVYPRDRRYENDVTPDRGDPQVVFPKTTAITAAATAALAQSASSPAFKQQFPESAALYLEKAKKGWAFLEAAIAKHGKDGAYQKITHYGNDFKHDDELAWAACEMYLATGDQKYQRKLAEWFNPADPETRKWNWWRLFEAYGHATRSYAFAEKSGRLERRQMEPRLLEKCEAEIVAAGEEQLQRAENSAYGTSFPTETKRTRTAGWYFSSDAAFDLAVAHQLDYPVMNDPRPKLLKALLSNVNYELGCNPANVSYLTGIGWKPPREIVHQYAQNDRRILPPGGIPLGNIQDGFGWLDHYGKELGELTYPADDDPVSPYPFYDRWGDSFNLKTEFVISNQARGLAYLAWLMAQTPLKTQPWKPDAAVITSVPRNLRPKESVALGIGAPGLNLAKARIVWETQDQEPVTGPFTFLAGHPGHYWIEAEALLPDGRRVVASTNLVVR
jgi:hypothetical protein